MSLEAAFDVIVEEMTGMGDGIAGFTGTFSHERSPENGNLTAALFVAKMLGGEGIDRFFQKGGRFTTQCDALGRNALTIVQQRLEDSRILQPEQAQLEIGEALDILTKLVAIQGGLFDVREATPRRTRILGMFQHWRHKAGL